MSNAFHDRLVDLLDRACPQLSDTRLLEFKNVFGAVGGYVDGNIFITHGRFGLALRLPEKTLGSLFEKGDAEHLRYFPKGHVKKEYAVLSEQVLEDESRFAALVKESVACVSDPDQPVG